ncbi:TetR/AcrR family transcriptional regulator [Nocardioides pocheonensis]|uniref:TetR/AcrR family transcriptional regulator n=1 Tax=Nocardioides pocheonensis TaxID=661485 RepID=A0A3N0GN65_9ACTN|nr:TetR/AcrR family transcriptional regulator [Nocardioides pocheonensis]RNM13666.1 TetR/AcrR family transcriptional regulator [Nocardioides pocheonensis]
MPTRSPAEKIRSTIPKVAGVSRRQQYSASTKRALVDVATRLFTEQGYAATSLDQVVAGARVTKGALYHHFSGKQGVFEAAFEQVERDASKRIRKALRGSRDPWEKALIGLRAFLEIVQDPSYQRVVIQEGPAILGYERFREQEERSSYGLVQDMVRDVLEDSTYDLSEEMLETFTRIFFGAMSAAGESVSSAADPRLAVARVETAIAFILTGLRTLADNGVELPDPADLLEQTDDE